MPEGWSDQIPDTFIMNLSLQNNYRMLIQKFKITTF